MKHLDNVEGFNSLEELAEQIGNLRYDSLEQFLRAFGDKIKKDGDADKERGRPQLSNGLYEIADKLYSTADTMKKVSDICEPYMDSG